MWTPAWSATQYLNGHLSVKSGQERTKNLKCIISAPGLARAILSVFLDHSQSYHVDNFIIIIIWTAFFYFLLRYKYKQRNPFFQVSTTSGSTRRTWPWCCTGSSRCPTSQGCSTSGWSRWEISSTFLMNSFIIAAPKSSKFKTQLSQPLGWIERTISPTFSILFSGHCLHEVTTRGDYTRWLHGSIYTEVSTWKYLHGCIYCTKPY